ncbi:MAG TPA: twin-arginine translocation signal domain-containing protein [Frankiaceae bacterium]|jgi:hypothetical protein|nr:twin-arginine translocation signal domain-containing protein [Frankiaceae bacterium]
MATSSSRRNFLRGCVLLAAAAAPLGVAGEALSLPSGTANGLRRSSFTPHLRTGFALVSADGAVHPATLLQVSDLAAGPRGHDRKFRLLFSVSSRPQGGIFELRHPRIAATELFVAPVGNGSQYEVVVDAR